MVFQKSPVSKSSNQPWFEHKPPENKNKHAIVVGAGLAGVTNAWALAQRGWKIDLLDRSPAIAQEGSGNPLGILMPKMSRGKSLEAAFYSLAYLKAVQECTRLKQKYRDLTWRQDGVLLVAYNERIQKQIDQIDCSNNFAQALSAKQASAYAGVSISREAFYFPLAGCLNPQSLCRYLIDDAGGRIQVRLDTKVHHLSQKDNQWVLWDQDGKIIVEAEIVILSNATQVLEFEQTCWLSLSTARGQISMAAATQKSKKIRCAICFEGYILPEINGEHLIGASFIRGDHNTEIREEDHRKNMNQLAYLFPDCFDFETKNLKGHAALRATTPDRMPLVGPVADISFLKTQYHDLHQGKPPHQYPKTRDLKGLYLNTGHGSRGLCSSFLSAEVLSAQICNEALPVSEEIRQALHPSRFVIRKFRSGKNK